MYLHDQTQAHRTLYTAHYTIILSTIIKSNKKVKKNQIPTFRVWKIPSLNLYWQLVTDAVLTISVTDPAKTEDRISISFLVDAGS